MKLSQKLLMVASWLESSENDLLVKAEQNEECLGVVANALVNAAEALKAGAAVVSELEPAILSTEALDEMAAVAKAFDESDDELLQKQASVLDEILLTLAAPRNSVGEYKMLENDRIEQLKKRYQGTKEKHDEMNKISDSVKAIENSPYYKAYRPLEAPLSTRSCPDHPGVLCVRIGDSQVQCVMDKKIYDYSAGYTLLSGRHVPGADVAMQTKSLNDQGALIFETRDQKLGLNHDQ